MALRSFIRRSRGSISVGRRFLPVMPVGRRVLVRWLRRLIPVTLAAPRFGRLLQKGLFGKCGGSARVRPVAPHLRPVSPLVPMWPPLVSPRELLVEEGGGQAHSAASNWVVVVAAA